MRYLVKVIYAFVSGITERALRKIPYFDLISRCENFVESQFPHSFGRETVYGNCAFLKNSHTRKLGEIAFSGELHIDGYDLLRLNDLTLYFPIFPFDPPENIRKPLVL